MYIKIVTSEFKSKYGQLFEIGKEYNCEDNKIKLPYNFTNDKNIGRICVEYFAPTSPLNLRFLEIEPIDCNDMDYEYDRLCCNKIKIIKEIPLDDIIKIDLTGTIKSLIDFLA